MMYRVSVSKLIGSVGLVLVFVLVSVSAPFASQVALAAPLDQVTLPSVGTDVKAGSEVKVPLTVVPVTSFSDGTINILFRFRRSGSVVHEGSSTMALVYSQIYDTKLVDLVYGLPSGFGAYGVKLGSGSDAQFTGTTINVVVYLDEVAQPVDGPPSGGGPSLPGGTTDTETGWQTYDPTEDKATVYVDPELTQSLFSDAPEAGVTLVDVQPVEAKGEVPQDVTANLPLDVLTQAGNATVDSVLKLGSIDVMVGPNVMKALREAVKAAAGSFSNLEIRALTSDEEETGEVLAGLGEDVVRLMTQASEVVTLSFWAVAPNGTATRISVSDLLLTVPFDVEKVENPAHVNLYRIGSLIYVGGKVAQGKVSGSLSDLADGQFIALEHNKTFGDIAGHWAQADVELMAAKHVVTGVSETAFEPQRDVTRAEFVTMLVRTLGIAEAAPESASFSDVHSGTWYFGYVEAAFQEGLAQGDSGLGGTFRPQDRIAREEMAALLIRAMKRAGKEAAALTEEEVADLISRFADGVKISDWAGYEAAQAVNEGIILGHDDGTFAPKGNGTRAESATMMSRFMKQVGIL